jgi:phosphomannomutase/phosphoglucomutase
MARLFGTAGARGVTNIEITPDLALRIAMVYADWWAEKKGKPPSLSVGHDTRYGAELLARVVASGFAAAGAHVTFYGTVPTGVFSMNTSKSGLDGGILITGSHMPPDRIGIIPMLGDGAYCPVEITDDLEARLRDFTVRRRAVPPDKLGRIEESFHPYDLYISELVQMVDARLIKSKHYHVLCDPANGTASYCAKELFQWLGCEVEMLHYDPKPVPDRPSECRAATCRIAIDRTAELRCDLGMCCDVDADRVLMIDQGGIPLSEDLVGAIFARECLRRGDTCVVPINSSGLIELVCAEIGATLEYCAVGQPEIVKAIKAHRAAYSYEESGKYFFARQQLWCDGLYSGAKMLEIMAHRGTSLADLAAAFPKFHQVKRKVDVVDARKYGAVADCVQLLKTRLTAGRVRDFDVDGFKRTYDDHSWLLVRASGTEPIVRVYSDAPTKERAEQLAVEGEAVLREVLR